MPFVFAGMYGPHGIEFDDGAHARRAPITILEGWTGNTPATIYTDRTKATTASNPVVTDKHGNLVFFAEPGPYRISYANVQVTISVPPDSADVGSAGGATLPIAQTDVTGLVAALSEKATPSQIDAAIAAMVDSSPATLDTLNELAAALGDDPNFAATLVDTLAGKAPISHSHAQSEVTNLVTDLVKANRQSLGSFMQPMRPRTPVAEVPTLAWGPAPSYTSPRQILANAAASLGLIDRGVSHWWSSGGFHYNYSAAGTDESGFLNFLNPYAVEFFVNGTEFAISIAPNAGAQSQYRIWVDGWDVTGLVTTSQSSANAYLAFTFATDKIRHIRMEVAGTFPFHSIYAPGTNYAVPADQNRFKMVMMGDSYTAGITNSVAAGLAANALPLGIARLTGWDVYSHGQSGTGYIGTPGAPATPYASSDRMAALALVPSSLNLIYIGGSGNDRSFTASALATAATAAWDTIAAARPGVPIVVAGPQPINQTYNGGVAAHNTALKNAALAHPAVRGYIDWVTPDLWWTGTGNSTARNGTGNSDQFIGSDGIHPSNVGYDYIARRTVSELAKIRI